MTRPTTADLADATIDLETIFYAHDPNGSPRRNTGARDVAKILNLLAWAIGEIQAGEQAAAHGPGVKDGYHTLQRGGTPTDVSTRTGDRDAYTKAVRNLIAGWLVEYGRMTDEWEREAMDVGRYPTRSEQSEQVG